MPNGDRNKARLYFRQAVSTLFSNEINYILSGLKEISAKHVMM